MVANLSDDNQDGHINGLDIPDIVTVNKQSMLTVMSGRGDKIHWTFQLSPITETSKVLPPTPAIGDLTGDGKPEIVAASKTRIIALKHDGSILWERSYQAWGLNIRCGALGIFDLMGDGKPEVVIGNLVFNGENGFLSAKGEFGVGSGHKDAGMMGVAADILQLGYQQIVVGNALYAPDGKVIWHNGLNDGFVAIANF